MATNRKELKKSTVKSVSKKMIKKETVKKKSASKSIDVNKKSLDKDNIIKENFYKNKLAELNEEIKKLKKENKNTALSEDRYKKYIESVTKKLELSENERNILEDKYKKILIEKEKSLLLKQEKLLKELDILKKDGSKENKKLDLLNEKIEKLDKSNKRLNQEKERLEKENNNIKKLYENAVSLKEKETREEKENIIELKNALKKSETEKEILKTKIKSMELSFKKQLEEKIRQSKKAEQKENKEKRANFNLLKEIKKQTGELKKRQEAVQKEQEKLSIIKKSVEDSARSIMTSISKGTVTPSSKSGEAGIIPEIGSDDEKRLIHLAGLLSTAMQTKREEEKQKETVVDTLSSEEENRLNRAADKLENMSSSGFQNKDLNDLKKRSFTIIDKIENSRVEINPKDTSSSDGASYQSAGSLSKQIEDSLKTQISTPTESKDDKKETQKVKTKLDKESSLIQPIVNVTVEAPKEESSRLSKPETSLRPASEIPTMNMKLIDDTDQYEKKLVITYGFENMPENMSYSKYKKILRNAARITLLGNLNEGLEMFKLVGDQNLPAEYKEMIDKNIQDITYYLRGLHRVRME